jgi:hypothetical protein
MLVSAADEACALNPNAAGDVLCRSSFRSFLMQERLTDTWRTIECRWLEQGGSGFQFCFFTTVKASHAATLFPEKPNKRS